ncbi:DegT/DnrJ/EryC1/StrS family aminotransferase, partial [Escherichia coli]|nr:DegT/DnrJ/EryC1/StrS family aminotransferase [Escherichia coli]
ALPAGGEVITTPFTFVATGNAILRCGLRPVFVDIAPATLTLDPAAVAAAVGPASVAILGVHVFGTPCDDAALAAIARRHGLTLLYD